MSVQATLQALNQMVRLLDASSNEIRNLAASTHAQVQDLAARIQKLEAAAEDRGLLSSSSVLEQLGFDVAGYRDCVSKCPEATSPTDVLPSRCVAECFRKF